MRANEWKMDESDKKDEIQSVREEKMMQGENERCEEVGCFKLFHNTILFDEDIHKSENINLQLRNNIIYV